MLIISNLSHPLLFPGSMDSNKLPQNHISTSASLKTRFFRNPRSSRLVAFASGGGTNGNGEVKEEGEANEVRGKLKSDRPPAFNLRWRDLLNPDPENILAVGLTGLLTWASIQVLWQLIFISFAIVLAALNPNTILKVYSKQTDTKISYMKSYEPLPLLAGRLGCHSAFSTQNMKAVNGIRLEAIHDNLQGQITHHFPSYNDPTNESKKSCHQE